MSILALDTEWVLRIKCSSVIEYLQLRSEEFESRFGHLTCFDKDGKSIIFEGSKRKVAMQAKSVFGEGDYTLLAQAGLFETCLAYRSERCKKISCRYTAFANMDLKCSGSDSEDIHHCHHCGDLDATSSGDGCPCCEFYFCRSCVDNFVAIELCDCIKNAPEWVDDPWHVCPPCFFAHKELSCTTESCSNFDNRKVAKEKWEEYNEYLDSRASRNARRPRKFSVRDLSPVRNKN